MNAGPADYRFGRIRLRLAERQLLIDGELAPIGARAFDLLTVLAERRNRLVSKDELLQLVWPKAIVEENTLQVHISALRKALGPHAIATVPGRGYRFTAVLDDAAESDPTPATAATVAAPALPGNLPSQLAPLIGREDDLKLLVSEITAHRLVTVVGAPGVGKTTLAMAAAHAVRHEWRDGVWKVELAPVTEPAQLPHAVAQALGIALNGPGSSLNLLVGVLQSRSLLLLLDNCEHLADAAAALASAIVAQASDVRVLATSQERLNVANERTMKLNPLAVPSADADPADAGRYGALRLFAERAQAADPRFELTSTNAAAVTEICRHLDGLPLAIELAAARIRVLGVQGVRDRLGERFRLLTGGARTAMRRHQTLRAAIDWTHALLSVVEQTVFRRLGSFVGSFTLELAERVAGDASIDEWVVLEALTALVDKSLVTMQDGDAPRYMLLESSSAFALERLAEAGETTEILRRHAHALRALFERTYEARYGEQGTLTGDDYAAQLRPDIDNLRSALHWSADSSAEESNAIALSTLLAEALNASGQTADAMAVLRKWTSRVAAMAEHDVVTRFWFSVANVGRDRWPDELTYGQALAGAEQGCVDLGWSRRLCRIRLMQAWRLMRRREYAAAEALLTDAITLEQTAWPAWLRSDRWNVQAAIYQQIGAYESAWAAYQAIDAVLPARGEDRRRALLTANRAGCFNFQGQWNEAVALLEPLVDQARSAQRQHDVAAWAYAHMVLALTELGRLTEAHERLREALPLWRADGILPLMLFMAIRLVVAEGRIPDALRLLGMEDASSHRHRLNDLLEVRIRRESQRLIETAMPDAMQRERLRREGAALDEEASIALCLGR